MIQGYDGATLLLELEALTAAQRRAFATACAEALLRHFGSSPTGHVAGEAECERSVAFCWDSVGNGPRELQGGDLLRAELQDILSEDEEGELGVMEHVIAGSYYALQCSQEGSAGQAELVAKNLYEAADHVVLANPGLDLAAPNAERDIIASDVVQRTLSLVAGIRDLVASRTFQDDGRPADISEVREYVGQGMGG